LDFLDPDPQKPVDFSKFALAPGEQLYADINLKETVPGSKDSAAVFFESNPGLSVEGISVGTEEPSDDSGTEIAVCYRRENQ